MSGKVIQILIGWGCSTLCPLNCTLRAQQINWIAHPPSPRLSLWPNVGQQILLIASQQPPQRRFRINSPIPDAQIFLFFFGPLRIRQPPHGELINWGLKTTERTFWGDNLWAVEPSSYWADLKYVKRLDFWWEHITRRAKMKRTIFAAPGEEFIAAYPTDKLNKSQFHGGGGDIPSQPFRVSLGTTHDGKDDDQVKNEYFTTTSQPTSQPDQ